jgi:hypothetical protein
MPMLSSIYYYSVRRKRSALLLGLSCRRELLLHDTETMAGQGIVLVEGLVWEIAECGEGGCREVEEAEGEVVGVAGGTIVMQNLLGTLLRLCRSALGRTNRHQHQRLSYLDRQHRTRWALWQVMARRARRREVLWKKRKKAK